MHAETTCLISVLSINIPCQKTGGRQVYRDLLSTQAHIARVLQPPPPSNLQCAASIELPRARGTSCTSKIKKPQLGKQYTAPVGREVQTCQLSCNLNIHSFGAGRSEAESARVEESQH